MTAAPSPLVSILTPSFNQGVYIRDTIESVLAQDHPDIEHIIVDGGSTDETLDVVRAYGDSVKLLSEPDDGQADALNKAFALSRGSIIGWLNSDDFFLRRDAVSIAVAALADQQADVAYGDAIWVDGSNTVLKISLRPSFDGRRLHRFDFLPQPATLFRRTVARGPLVDPALEYAIDYALWLQLAARGARFAKVDELLAAMRRHDGAKSVKANTAMRRETSRLVEDGTQSPAWWQIVGDLLLMLLLKARGLAAFRRRSVVTERAAVRVRLPNVVVRPLYQLGLMGSHGTALLLTRELLSRLERSNMAEAGG